jgi:hypothetical protein
MLFVKLAKAGGDWLWRSDRIDNKPKLPLGCLVGFVVERTKGRIENIGDEVEPIPLCDLLLWMMIVAEAGWILAPSLLDSRNIG